MNYGISKGDTYKVNKEHNRFEENKPIKPFQPKKVTLW